MHPTATEQADRIPAVVVRPYRAQQMAAVTPSTCGDVRAMVSPGALAEALRVAMSGLSAQESLQPIIALAVSVAPCDRASITMLGPDHTVQNVASSDYQVTDVDQLQIQLGEGPSLDAAFTDELILVEDIASQWRWPRWAPLAEGLGIDALACIHLHTDIPLGTLNLYSERPREFDELDLEAARVVAAVASVVLAHTRAVQDLRGGIDARNLIGQAQGMLMARCGLTPDEALAALRRYSYDTNTPLAVLAEELTSAGRLPALERELLAVRR